MCKCVCMYVSETAVLSVNISNNKKKKLKASSKSSLNCCVAAPPRRHVCSHQEPIRHSFEGFQRVGVLDSKRVWPHPPLPSLRHALFLLFQSVSNHLITPLKSSLEETETKASFLSCLSSFLSPSPHQCCCAVAPATVNGGWFVSDTLRISTAGRYRERRAAAQDEKEGKSEGKMANWHVGECSGERGACGCSPWAEDEERGRKKMLTWWMLAGWTCLCLVGLHNRYKLFLPVNLLLFIPVIPLHPSFLFFCFSLFPHLLLEFFFVLEEWRGLKVTGRHFEVNFLTLRPSSPRSVVSDRAGGGKTERERAMTNFCLSH